MTEQTTAFGQTALKAWATAGMQFDNASGQYKQLVTAFKNMGINTDAAWFSQNPTQPIAKIRELFDKKIANSIGKGTNLSIRKVYIELQRAPYGMKYNALSAFILGIALRHILDKGYQWDNLQKTGPLDTDVLAEIIESVVKDDGQDKIKGEKLICRLSREEKAFVEKAPLMFDITNTISDARVEDVLLQIQTRIEQISGKVPLWMLPEYIASKNDEDAEIITTALNNICLAGSTSSKSGKSEDRTNAIKEVGKFILDNPALINKVSGYVQPANFVAAFRMYVDRNAPELHALAESIGDYNEYYKAILSKAADAAGLLWKQADISTEIEETTSEYEIIKLLKPLTGSDKFVPYITVIEMLRNAVTQINKLPKVMLATAVPSISVLLSLLTNGGTVRDIERELSQNIDIIKALFFDVFNTKTIEILKQRLIGITITDAELSAIYSGLQSGYSHDESAFLDGVRTKIESSAKESVALKIKEEWNRLSMANTPNDWAVSNGIPTRFLLQGLTAANDILSAVTNPGSFSAEKLGELLDVMGGLSPVSVTDCQKRFTDETIPRRFAKFNIGLSSLLDFLKSKYGSQPNNWPTPPDINDFVHSQYKGTFAPQVAEKIKKTSAEDLKNRLLILAQESPDLGLLFWEG